jgi:pilus assembly protein TadC
MTGTFMLSVALAAGCGALSAALYVAWPRRMTAEEWIQHRRALSGEPPAARRARPQVSVRLPRWLTADAYRAQLVSLGEDLALLRLAGGDGPETALDLGRYLLRLGGVGAVGGALAGAAFWGLAGGASLAPIAVLTPTAAIVAPLLVWLRLRRRAASLRASIHRRLPRLLTGARMVLESGAATPERALAVAVGIYDDPATALLREAIRLREVRRIALEDALEMVAQRYRLPTLFRLADAFRVGSRYGTQMASILSGFAQELRRSSHADYRERMTRAPVLMTLPALLFFVAPLLLLVLFLVFAPLSQTLGQL